MRELGIFRNGCTSSWSLIAKESEAVLRCVRDYCVALAYQELLYTLRYSEVPPGVNVIPAKVQMSGSRITKQESQRVCAFVLG